MRRENRDARRPERLLIAFVASVLVHTLLAILLFSVASRSSEQSSEPQLGGEIVTLSSPTRTISRATTPKSAKALPHPVVPHAARRAPAQNARPNGAPRNRHELSKQSPTAPPNPPPLPVASPRPQTSPAQTTIADAGRAMIPAAPTSAPTAAVPPVIRVAARPAPSPAPQPTAVRTAAPVTPAPIPTTAATFAPVIADATPRPVASPALGSPKVVIPKATPGAPSPGPAQRPAARPLPGKEPKPGPKPASGKTQVAPIRNPLPGRPVELPPTPKPSPPSARPRRTPPPPAPTRDLNARLRALIPHGPLTPSSHEYRGDLGAIGRNVRPTPPPEVLARTKFVFSESGKRSGTEDLVVMYVTDVRGEGPLTVCRGWLMRYPHVPHPVATTKWIVESDVSYACSRRGLSPYVQPTP